MDPLSSFDFMEWTRTQCSLALYKLKQRFLPMETNRTAVGFHESSHYTRWLPVDDIRQLDYIFMPIKLEDAHFVLGFVHVKRKTTYIFDSTGRERRKLSFRLYRLMQILLGETEGWSWVSNLYGPRQSNACDCGLYVCIIANFLSDGLGTSDIKTTKAKEYREKVAIEIYGDRAI